MNILLSNMAIKTFYKTAGYNCTEFRKPVNRRGTISLLFSPFTEWNKNDFGSSKFNSPSSTEDVNCEVFLSTYLWNRCF